MSAEAYTVDDICIILGCEAETAVERIMAGDLPGLKFGRGWIIPRDAFSQRLNELALEAAQARRKDRAAGKVASKVIQAAQGVGKPAGRRVARVPPALPGLPGGGAA